MKTLIELKPVHQTGHNCKTVAIAAVDQYFAELIKFNPTAQKRDFPHFY